VGIPTTSQETAIAWSSALSPCRDSRAKATASSGLSTPREMRVCIWPESAIGRSCVMLMLAAPTRSSAAAPQRAAPAAIRAAAAQIEIPRTIRCMLHLPR